MKTYQDYQNATNKQEFIQEAIQEYIETREYKMAITSRSYYDGYNDILERLQWFWNSKGAKEVDKFKANNTISNNFYKKIIMQEKSYLLANGVQLEDKYKNKVKKIDKRIQEVALNSLLDGKSYAYFYVENGSFKIQAFKGIEFCPLYDERTGKLMSGIRFYQLNTNKPMYIEFYEQDGVTEYQIVEGNISLLQEKRAYITNNKSTKATGVYASEGKNWFDLPIEEIKSDAQGYPRLSCSLKTKIDLYDIILSDFGNNLEDSRDVYWVLKNYNGEDMGAFLEDYKYYKAVKTDDEGDATAHTIEVPYQARQTALDILKAKIYEEAMAVDMSILSGGSLTNIAIKAAYTDLDLKCDAFEEEMVGLVDDILEFYEEFVAGIGKEVEVETSIDFIRRTPVNDTETIQNIMLFREDIDQKTALELNPLVDNKNIDSIVKAREEEGTVWEAEKVKEEV